MKKIILIHSGENGKNFKVNSKNKIVLYVNTKTLKSKTENYLSKNNFNKEAKQITNMLKIKTLLKICKEKQLLN